MLCVCVRVRGGGGGGGGVGVDGGAAGRGGELQPAQARPAGSGGAAPRHRDAFVGVIILTLTLCWWSCLLFREARTPAPPFMAPGAGGQAGWGGGGGGGGSCQLVSGQVSGGPG